MSEKIRTLHLLDTTGFAGTERHVLTLLDALIVQGVRPYLACRSASPLHERAMKELYQTLPVFGVNNPFHALKTLRRFVQSENIQIIHGHNGRMLLLAALLNRLTGVKALYTQHFLDPQFAGYRGLKKTLAEWGHHWANRRLARVIAVSEAARDSMLKRERLEPARIVTIPNGLTPPPGPLLRPTDVRTEFQIAPTAPLVVTVARLGAEKGLEYLLDAMSTIQQELPAARLLIVGEGPLRQALEAQAQKNGVASDVQFTGFRADAQALIAAADLFVLPSPAEPFGLVLLEAMALSKPVIATRAGGPMEIVADGETGILVPPRDSSVLAQKIVSLLSNPLLCRDMGCKGQRRFEAEFTATKMAQATRAVYEQALA